MLLFVLRKKSNMTMSSDWKLGEAFSKVASKANQISEGWLAPGTWVSRCFSGDGGCSGFAAVSFLCASAVRRFHAAARAQVVTLLRHLGRSKASDSWGWCPVLKGTTWGGLWNPSFFRFMSQTWARLNHEPRAKHKPTLSRAQMLIFFHLSFMAAESN